MNQQATGLDAGSFLQRFSVVNMSRALRWHPQGLESWSTADWAVALQGEVGEVLEVLAASWNAPLNRASLANEIGDAYAYLDLFAQSCGVTVEQCTAGLFVGRHHGTTWGGILVAAEAGKICDVVKKLNRVRDGLAGNRVQESELYIALRQHIGATAVALMQLADAAQLVFAHCVAEKFNMVSVRMNMPERI